MSFEINGEPVLANVQTYSTDLLVENAIYAADNETADRPNFETTRSSALTDGELALDVLRMTSGAYLKFKTFQGEISGYTSGGAIAPTDRYTTIDKFPFTVDAGASSVGSLTQAREGVAGQSSTTHGYTTGGYAPAASPIFTNVIDKFPFATDTNATNVGILTESRASLAGQSSTTHGYSSGGSQPPVSNVIDKFPFASDTNASDVGDLSVARNSLSSHSSSTHGYVSRTGTPGSMIEKFSFVTDSNAIGVGDLTQARYNPAGQSSSVNGYSSGGNIPVVNTIDKFPFTSDTDATDVGDLSSIRGSAAGQSSVTDGYVSGGENNDSPTIYALIDKFPFSTDIDAVSVGSLTQTRRGAAGQQV